MKWTQEAEDAISKVPFFVRKKVRKRVEKEALERGGTQVTLNDVNATRKRFLTNMESEIKGYQIEACFSQGGCPNSCVSQNTLMDRLEAQLKAEDLLGFLRQRVKGDLKFHHEFRISVSECPNACSQPQIKDIGIIAALSPKVGNEDCVGCGACVTVCKENAITLPDTPFPCPSIDSLACVACGACIRACPTGTLEPYEKGYRVLLGGRLGRHPRLARELNGIFTEDRVLEIVKACLAFYKENSKAGERFSTLLTDSDFGRINTMFS